MAFNAIRRALGTLGDAAVGKASDAAKDQSPGDHEAPGPSSPQFAEMYRSIDAAFTDAKDNSSPASFMAMRANRDAGWTRHGAQAGMNEPTRGRQGDYERQVMSAAPYRAHMAAADEAPEVDKEALFTAAREAMRESHSPYSQFPVGAAILSESRRDLLRLQRRERLLSRGLVRGDVGHRPHGPRRRPKDTGDRRCRREDGGHHTVRRLPSAHPRIRIGGHRGASLRRARGRGIRNARRSPAAGVLAGTRLGARRRRPIFGRTRAHIPLHAPCL